MKVVFIVVGAVAALYVLLCGVLYFRYIQESADDIQMKQRLMVQA